MYVAFATRLWALSHENFPEQRETIQVAQYKSNNLQDSHYVHRSDFHHIRKADHSSTYV